MDASAPARSDDVESGPLKNRLPCAHESRRLIAGGFALLLPAFITGTDPVSSSARDHASAGRRGVSVTAMPGADTSIGINPVATSTCCHTSTPGISSGRPVVVGSVTSASPTRKVVCVHVLPCAPTRDGAPAAVPPVSMRSAMTSATIMSRSAKRFVLDGSAPSGSTVISAPSGGRSSNDAGVCARALAAAARMKSVRR